MHLCIYASVHLCMCAYAHLCGCVCVCVCRACMCAYMCVRIRARVCLGDEDSLTTLSWLRGTTPGLHNKIPAHKIFARVWVAQKSFCFIGSG